MSDFEKLKSDYEGQLVEYWLHGSIKSGRILWLSINSRTGKPNAHINRRKGGCCGLWRVTDKIPLDLIIKRLGNVVQSQSTSTERKAEAIRTTSPKIEPPQNDNENESETPAPVQKGQSQNLQLLEKEDRSSRSSVPGEELPTVNAVRAVQPEGHGENSQKIPSAIQPEDHGENSQRIPSAVQPGSHVENSQKIPSAVQPDGHGENSQRIPSAVQPEGQGENSQKISSATQQQQRSSTQPEERKSIPSPLTPPSTSPIQEFDPRVSLSHSVAPPTPPTPNLPNDPQPPQVKECIKAENTEMDKQVPNHSTPIEEDISPFHLSPTKPKAEKSTASPALVIPKTQSDLATPANQNSHPLVKVELRETQAVVKQSQISRKEPSPSKLSRRSQSPSPTSPPPSSIPVLSRGKRQNSPEKIGPAGDGYLVAPPARPTPDTNLPNGLPPPQVKECMKISAEMNQNVPQHHSTPIGDNISPKKKKSTGSRLPALVIPKSQSDLATPVNQNSSPTVEIESGTRVTQTVIKQSQIPRREPSPSKLSRKSPSPTPKSPSPSSIPVFSRGTRQNSPEKIGGHPVSPSRIPQHWTSKTTSEELPKRVGSPTSPPPSSSSLSFISDSGIRSGRTSRQSSTLSSDSMTSMPNSPKEKAKEPEIAECELSGIQGCNNSCYADAALFALFAYTTAFDHFVTSPSKKIGNDSAGNTVADNVRKILRREICRPLRDKFFVSHESVWRLRSILGSEVHPDYLSEFMGAEEFIQAVAELAKVPELLQYDSGQGDYIHEIHLTEEEKQGRNIPVYSIVENLLHTSLSVSGVKLVKKPERGLIIKMPISNGHLIGATKGIIPNITLNLVTGDDNEPAQMTLASVICLRSQHFVAFARSGKGDKWCFMDSKPTVSKPEVKILNGIDETVIKSLEDMETFGNITVKQEEAVKCNNFNLFRDAYICIYT